MISIFGVWRSTRLIIDGLEKIYFLKVFRYFLTYHFAYLVSYLCIHLCNVRNMTRSINSSCNFIQVFFVDNWSFCSSL